MPRRRAGRLAAQAAVLAVVAGATSAFAVMHKQVTVDVDGRAVQVEGFGRTVGAVLAGAKIHVGEGDVVAPGLGDSVTQGQEIVVRHGRDLDVVVDGEPQRVWTTALTVGEAVDSLGLRDGDVRLSASRSEPLGRDELRVSTEKTIHLVVDGQVIDGVSSASTVRDALKDIGLVLDEGDEVSVPLDATAVDGLAVLVTRAQTDAETRTEAVKFETDEVDDPGLAKGTKLVVTKGKAGIRTTTYQLETVGGVVTGRTALSSVVTTEPVTQVVHVGTMVLPDPSDIHVSPGSAQAIARELAAARGWGDDQFACLLPLWKHESGWRVNAENRSSGAYGIPQALPGSKMASVGADWRTNPTTQITWGLGYIKNRYKTPCGAWGHFQSQGWY
ncbi:MAG: ubiquitin-like domain-containing protein [Brevundimonas sp.]